MQKMHFESLVADNCRLTAIVITAIDANGRVAQDGRLSVGDKITAIRSRPIYQMSLQRCVYVLRLKNAFQRTEHASISPNWTKSIQSNSA